MKYLVSCGECGADFESDNYIDTCDTCGAENQVACPRCKCWEEYMYVACNDCVLGSNFKECEA